MANLEEMLQLDLINILEDVEIENHDGVERRVFQQLEAFSLRENQFIKLFRLPKNVVLNLIEELEPYIAPPNRTSALNIKTKVLTALRFYASGGYQTDIGFNVYTAVSQSSVSRCVAEVSAALNQPAIFQRWIKFPNTLEELQVVRTGFYEKFQFPGVVGTIDCTHVAILAPPDEEHIYVNRKGYHSINVQLVCDSDKKIIHGNARYPGSTNDSFIWNTSSLKDFFCDLHERGHTNFYLLGDSGYALRSYMMTPILNPEPQVNTPEYRYNQRQMSTRALIERCNGLLKMRFRCLLKHRVLHYKADVACKIINACLVLHNMCIQYNVPEPSDDEEEDNIDFGIMDDDVHYNEPIGRVNPDLAKGRAMRQKLINNYFI